MNFIYDIYRKNRGNYSRFMLLHCTNCASLLALYQKDGPGPLKRLYKDRIRYSVNAREVENHLVCGSCRSELGISYNYEKESRPAFKLNPTVIKKQIVSRKYTDEYFS